MPQAALEPAMPASERPQTHDLDSAATEIGCLGFYSCKYSYGYLCYIQYQSYRCWFVAKITRKCQKVFTLRSFSILFPNIFHVSLRMGCFFKLTIFSLPINYDASCGKHKFTQPFTKAQQKYPTSILKANYLNLYSSFLPISCQKTGSFFSSLLPVFDTVFYSQYFSALNL
jgi:hypothetical protein